MIIIGTIIAIVIAIALSFLLGPFGGIILISIMFGFVLSTYMRNKEIHNDLQRIKEKLGILERDDFNMTNEEIEEELEKDYIESREMNETNKDIEKELGEYIELNKDNGKK